MSVVMAVHFPNSCDNVLWKMEVLSLFCVWRNIVNWWDWGLQAFGCCERSWGNLPSHWNKFKEKQYVALHLCTWTQCDFRVWVREHSIWLFLGTCNKNWNVCTLLLEMSSRLFIVTCRCGLPPACALAPSFFSLSLWWKRKSINEWCDRGLP